MSQFEEAAPQPTQPNVGGADPSVFGYGDLSDEPDPSELRTVLPAGWYECELVGADLVDKLTEKGRQQIGITLRTLDSEAFIWHRLYSPYKLDPDTMETIEVDEPGEGCRHPMVTALLKVLLRAVGMPLDISGKSFMQLANELDSRSGVTLRVKVRVRKDEVYGDSNDVTDFTPPQTQVS